MLDAEQIMELLEADANMPAATGISDAAAARLLDDKNTLERQLAAGRTWWESRRTALKRAVGWIDSTLGVWALAVHRENGLKTFPCGEGMARVRKARTVVEWDDEASRGWSERAAVADPSIIKSFNRSALLDQCVAWSRADDDGVCTAMDAATGEVLPGLVMRERAGEVTCSVNGGGR